MVAALVDSTIVVDLLRRFPLAEAWYARQQNLGLTYAVWLEVLEGAQNKPKQTSAHRTSLSKLLRSDICATLKLSRSRRLI